MTMLFREARFGFRLLRRNPSFTTVAVMTLALGIAATTAIFSVVYGTFFAPLPYRQADRLVRCVACAFVAASEDGQHLRSAWQML